jgi:hypothetical protein
MDEASKGTGSGVYRSNLGFAGRKDKTQVSVRQDRFIADNKPSEVSFSSIFYYQRTFEYLLTLNF